ncbi:hypothetical protein HPP92_027033 [Vanilla planifolia]|uniref:Uncharacterized protein n=1 Tax=Vanilla planifolia TaxID=51239 RepID=A0A835U8M3_VANPL|nr:hypothetical protein HPP92_027033 [Vanilla planifolia]
MPDDDLDLNEQGKKAVMKPGLSAATILLVITLLCYQARPGKKIRNQGGRKRDLRSFRERERERRIACVTVSSVLTTREAAARKLSESHQCISHKETKQWMVGVGCV